MFIFKQKKGVLRLILLCTSIEMQMIDFFSDLFMKQCMATVYSKSICCLFGD